MSNTITNYIFEVKTRPNPLFLDKRGGITEKVIRETFDHWVISDNTINFLSSKYPKLTAFFSFNNLGLSMQCSSKEDFLKVSDEFIKSTWEFVSNDSIIRLGVRSQILTEANSFSELYNLYKEKLLKMNETNLKIFGSELVDLGLALDFSDGKDSFKIMAGPMEKNQSKNIFGEAAFEVGKFLDLDYSRKEISPYITIKNVMEFVNTGIERANDIAQKII